MKYLELCKKNKLSNSSKYFSNKKLIKLPGGKRSGLLFDKLLELIKNKSVIFFLDKADPKNFDENLDIKPGQHIHKIFEKGEEWNDNGKIYIHPGTINSKGFVRIIQDKLGNNWAILDHNIDKTLDELLIESLKVNINN